MASLADVRVGIGYICAGHRCRYQIRFASCESFDQSDEVSQKDRLAATEIDYFEAHWPVGCREDASNNVANISPIPMHLSAVVDGNFLAEENIVGNLVGHHIDSSARSINRKEACSGKVQAINMMVCKPKYLRSALTGWIRRQGPIAGIVFDKGHL